MNKITNKMKRTLNLLVYRSQIGPIQPIGLIFPADRKPSLTNRGAKGLG